MPLLSLIEDNLNFVLDLGIDACSLSVKGRSKAEERRIGELYNDIRQIKYKIVYLTPEKIVNSPGFVACLEDLY